MNKENFKEVHKHLNEELTLALVGLTYTTYFSLAVNQEDHKNPMLDDFSDVTFENMTPSSLYQSMITTISNHVLAIIRLVELGLDTSARALIRVLAETIFIFIIVFSSKEHFDNYRNGMNDEDADSIWYRLFAKKRMQVELKKIEKRIGLPEEIVSEINKIRTSIYKEFSSVVHSSAYTSILGSYAFDFNNDQLQIGVGGKASKASKNTLSTLNWLLFYFSLMTKGVLNNLFEFKPRSDNEIWRVVFPIRECFIELYLKITYKDEYESISSRIT
ncbi:hypothetical protein BS614_11790 [Paenibacillus xylanexedens]|uniref:hypothetical protein n=1 Tax=Paenibacillus xylanexedens TaxID=528191 RepID=UPI0009381D7F|nr:hypothetical protein [Paenibacillus xylanexedens]APO44612.1 hypothetical protein BS614_11790 [Paenibacillus xylanexedens]